MALAPNAEAWASTRIGIFFPAHNQTPADGNLTGQCVTLNKWFLHEMTDVPLPFSARGDARYVGRTLVNQGHAVQVPYEQRKRGDFAVFEYGTYGHIGVLLDQDRIFEQNVNVGGVARRLVDGAYVYASRIGRLSETWRPVRATIYRIKSYREDDDMIVGKDVGYDALNRLHHQIVGNWNMSKAYWDSIQGRKFSDLMIEWSNHPAAETAIQQQVVGENAIKDRWDQQIYSLQAELKKATDALAEANKTITSLQVQVTEQQKSIEDLTRVISIKDAEIERQAKEIEALKAQVGDNTKWETLKALLRELLGIK